MALALSMMTLPAHASLVYELNTAEPTQQAKEIRMGEVISTWTSPDPQNKMIYTYVKIRVDQTLKGAQANEILIRQPGGTYVDPGTKQTFRQQVHGMDTFVKGEKAVFFIEHAKDGAPSVMFQGKHTIQKDAETGKTMTRHVFSKDVHYVQQNHKNVSKNHRLYAREKRQSLQELVSDIQAAVGKGAEQQR
jgi:hypothetical protein